MIKVKFYMKSRNIIEFVCESIELSKNGFGVLTGYKIKHGESKKRLMEVAIPDIEGVTIDEIGCDEN